jgi:hypothetical protein
LQHQHDPTPVVDRYHHYQQHQEQQPAPQAGPTQHQQHYPVPDHDQEYEDDYGEHYDDQFPPEEYYEDLEFDPYG